MEYIHITRDEAIRRIKTALQKRSGHAWSVSGGRGTAWGWITIKAVKKFAANEYGNLTEDDQQELAKLLGLSRPVHFQGQSIADGHGYYEEFIDRAEGRVPTVFGERYWD